MEQQQRPSVYIPNLSAHDFSSAERFGDLKPLTDGYIYWDQINLAHRKMAELLRDSKPEDFIIVTGPASITAVATSIFARLHGRVNLLVFNSEKQDYLRYDVMIDTLLNQ